MITVFKDYTFAAAHAIRGHQRGCERLHGHNYRVRVHVAAEKLDPLGMVIDFADLKAMVGTVLEPFDHRVLNDIAPFDARNPTAELVSQHVYDEVKRLLLGFDGGRVRIRRVEVWENESACAICEE